MTAIQEAVATLIHRTIVPANGVLIESGQLTGRYLERVAVHRDDLQALVTLCNDERNDDLSQ